MVNLGIEKENASDPTGVPLIVCLAFRFQRGWLADVKPELHLELRKAGP